MTPNWQIFVTFHQRVYPEYYSVDPSFDPKRYTFLKLNPEFRSELDPKCGFRMMREVDLPGYDSHYQKMCYHNRSALYHIFKSGAYREYDFIGFLEYDYKLETSTGSPKEVTSFIDQSLKGKVYVPLSGHNTVKRIYRQNLQLNGRNCMEQIVMDFNDFFGTSYGPDCFKDWPGNFCSSCSFVVPKGVFEQMMSWIAFVMENRLMECIAGMNLEIAGKRPSTFGERYVGAFLLLSGVKSVPCSLVHMAEGHHCGYRYESK